MANVEVRMLEVVEPMKDSWADGADDRVVVERKQSFFVIAQETLISFLHAILEYRFNITFLQL